MGCTSSQPQAGSTSNAASATPSLHVQSVESDISMESTKLKYDDDWKVVHSASRWNKLDDLKQYLEDPRAANCVDTKNGNYPAHISAQNGHLDGLKLLLNYKADVNAQNGKGNTPLHMALSYDYYDCVKLLLAHGANENVLNNAGFPANRGLDGDKSIPLAAFIVVEKTKDKTQLIAALDMCASSTETLTMAAFASAGLKVKKVMGEEWTDDIQTKFKAIVDKLE